MGRSWAPIVVLLALVVAACAPPFEGVSPTNTLLNGDAAAGKPAQPPTTAPMPTPEFENKHISVTYMPLPAPGKAVDAKLWKLLPEAEIPAGSCTRVEVPGYDKLSERDLDAILSLPNVVELRLNVVTCTEEYFVALMTIPTLRTIDAHSCTEATGLALASMEGNPNLEVAHFRMCYKLDDSVGAWFAKCPRLTSLRMDRCNFSDAFVRELGSNLKLTALSLAESDISDASISTFADIKSLVFLGLEDTLITGANLALLSSLPALKQLELRRCRRFDVETLSVLPSFPALERVGLEKAVLSDSALDSLARISTLKHLYWQSCTVAQTGMALLAQSKSLEELQAYDCPGFNDAAVLELVALASLRKLEYWLNDNLTEPGAAAFKKARPDVEVAAS